MKSLESGPSSIVPIKCPRTLRQRIREMLRVGETLSELTRQLWEREAARREKRKQK